MMEYTINKLSKISGVSTRTLRYYDEIGLLKPARVSSSNYRIYGQVEVDELQQILFYRELGFSLESIKKLLTAPDFDRANAFATHLSALHEKRNQLDNLILNVTKSIADLRGEIIMSDKEKFEGFKQNLIDKNEEKYGKEIREKYGELAVEQSYSKIKGLTNELYEEGERLRLELEKTLKIAFETGNPSGELAQKACDLHKQWICIYAPHYSKDYHLGLGEMYVIDERFRANYDKIAPGCTEFLRDAINIYCSDK